MRAVDMRAVLIPGKPDDARGYIRQSERGYHCKTCGEPFPTTQELRAHMLTKHPHVFTEEDRRLCRVTERTCRYCGRHGLKQGIGIHELTCVKNPHRRTDVGRPRRAELRAEREQAVYVEAPDA
jgi:type II secretory ATPase GspE/PulE/Tfp pilus assembly ATPase PilB-like protein